MDEDCAWRQRTEKQLNEVRAGIRDSLIAPHPEILRDFAQEKAAANVTMIYIMGDTRSPHFAAVADYPNLQDIELYDTRGTDELLKHLAGATRVTILGTDSADISDVGLEAIARMPALERLILFCPTGEMTSEGLKKLGNIKTLKSIEELSLSEEELAELREALPDVRIEIEEY